MNRVGIRGRPIELYVRFVDTTGALINADDIPSVAIYDSNGALQQAGTRVGVGLANDPGVYVFNYEIPLDGVDGYSSDVWTAKIGDDTVTSAFSFWVTSAGDVVVNAACLLSSLSCSCLTAGALAFTLDGGGAKRY